MCRPCGFGFSQVSICFFFIVIVISPYFSLFGHDGEKKMREAILKDDKARTAFDAVAKSPAFLGHMGVSGLNTSWTKVTDAFEKAHNETLKNKGLYIGKGIGLCLVPLCLLPLLWHCSYKSRPAALCTCCLEGTYGCGMFLGIVLPLLAVGVIAIVFSGVVTNKFKCATLVPWFKEAVTAIIAEKVGPTQISTAGLAIPAGADLKTFLPVFFKQKANIVIPQAEINTLAEYAFPDMTAVAATAYLNTWQTKLRGKYDLTVASDLLVRDYLADVFKDTTKDQKLCDAIHKALKIVFGIVGGVMIFISCCYCCLVTSCCCGAKAAYSITTPKPGSFQYDPSAPATPGRDLARKEETKPLMNGDFETKTSPVGSIPEGGPRPSAGWCSRCQTGSSCVVS
jgi:hypothetical protein